MSKTVKELKGIDVFIWFLAFFVLIIVVNFIFIYTALSTHSGLVTDDPYEKGLKYDHILEAARNQPDLNSTVTFEDNILSFTLKDQKYQPIEIKKVHAKIIRPVQDGQDFTVLLEPKGAGLYQTALDLPMKGQWTVKLSAEWNNQIYHTTYYMIAR